MSAGGRRVTIGIIGDFDRGKHSHWATEAALFHAAARAGLTVEPRWVGTPALAAASDVGACLRDFDGIWGAPGSPFVSFDGALRGIEFARQSARPYLGTCAGFQYALIELTRNVLGIADADSADNGSDGRTIATLFQPQLSSSFTSPHPVVVGFLRACCG